MPTSQSQNSAPDAMMTKLLEVDAQLASQETKVAAQLESVREKRKSLQTVIDMFGSGSEATVPALSAMSLLNDAPAVTSNGAATQAIADVSSPAADFAEEPDPEVDESIDDEESAEPIESEQQEAATPVETSRKPRGRRGKATKAAKASATTRAPKSTSKGRGKSNSSGAASWQHYVREEFENTTLPQAVLAVLEKEPNDVVEVPSILDAIFVDEIPKQARTSARDRLSNILSVGLKNNKWYRGKTGHYSVSKEAALASLV
ncbi:MAG: hypothetical protein VKK04_11730 [Synechococcales bacterium]|nr:hypothetical protein [Synechococcales bacterium]